MVKVNKLLLYVTKLNPRCSIIQTQKNAKIAVRNTCHNTRTYDSFTLSRTNI